jgi:hypothetical protein
MKTKIPSIIKDRKAKGALVYATAIVLAIIVVVGALGVSGRISFSVNSQQEPTVKPTIPPTGGQQVVNGDVEVTRKLALSLGNKWSSDMAEMMVKFYPVDSQQAYETVYTDSTGYALTTKSFRSGNYYNVYLENSTSKMWINDWMVPYMSQADANGGASDPNQVNDLAGFVIGTFTTDSLKAGTTAINDNGAYNFTESGSTPTFRYELDNTGADNTGLVDSYSPLTAQPQNWGTWVVVALSGTGYSDITVSGTGVLTWDSGSTRYAAIQYDSNALSKWVDGSSGDYVTGYGDMDSHTFKLDAGSYSGTGVTMQITAYAYADIGYAMEHNSSNFGNAKVTISEQTVTLQAV